MTDWTTARVTPEMQAELRRLLDAATPVPWAQGDPAFGGRNAQCVVSISSEAMGRDVMGPMLRPALFDVELIVAAVNALLALLDAAAERDRLAGAVERVRALATGWATQPNDYDEDTEQQIEDGGAILRALDATPETGGES